MGITAFYGPAMRDEEGVALLRSTQSIGYRHFDTAEVYRQGEDAVVPGSQRYNEELCALFFAAIPRDSFVVATKFFPGLHDGKCDYETVSAAVDASLSRLGLLQIDLYYLHRMPATVELLEEWMHSMARVVSSGRVAHVGLSEAPASWLRRAHAIHPIAAVQQEWSLLTREPIESEVVPCCRNLGVAIVAYSPLARNLLAQPADAPTDWRKDHPRYAPDNLAKNRELASRVAALASAKGVSAATLSLAWVLNKAKALGVTCVAIPGTTNAAHAAANFMAECIELTGAEMAQLEALGATVAGERANESYTNMAIEGKR